MKKKPMYVWNSGDRQWHLVGTPMGDWSPGAHEEFLEDSHRADHTLTRPADSASGTVVRVVNEGTGVPRVLEAVGAFKCLTCDAFTEDHVICEDCRVAIGVLRAGPYTEVLMRFLSVLTDRPALLAAFETLTDQAIAEYFLGRIREYREH